MSRRTRRPTVTTLPLSCGDTLTVRTHLNTGETRQTFARMYRAGGNGDTVLDPLLVGLSKIVGYLLDWTFLDCDDKPIVIADQPAEVVTAALDALDPEDFKEVLRAIEAHDDAMAAARAAEKNAQDGAKAASAISPSPFAVAGASSGSAS